MRCAVAAGPIPEELRDDGSGRGLMSLRTLERAAAPPHCVPARGGRLAPRGGLILRLRAELFRAELGPE